MKTTRILLAIALLFSALLVSHAKAIPENAAAALQYYFELLATENFESAGQMWAPEAQERSSRFGITYTDIPVRVDAASPIVRDLPVMRNYLQPAVKQITGLETVKYVRLEYSNVVNSELVNWYYYARLDGDYYWFIYPQDYYGKDWAVTETKYFRIHAHPDKQVYLNQAALDEADRFVEWASDSLGLDKSVRSNIAEAKIEYFFCPSDSLVKEMTGQSTKGLLDLASNDIISADFPHFHEVMHLLTNIRLKEIPIYTLPLIREGFAVKYGGRWGKRPTALMELGVFLYQQKLVELDSILTVDGFEASAGADIAYPVAGLFTSYLMEKIGQPKYFELYNRLSGNKRAIDTLPADAIRQMLVEAAVVPDWAGLAAGFDAYLSKIRDQIAFARAGAGKKSSTVLRGDNFVITKDKEWLCFEFTADSSGEVQGNVLFDKDPRLEGKRSHLFEEQYGMTQPYEGYRYGVRYDKNEAGLYDYATNELVAKFIVGISPDDGYYNESARQVRIRFKAQLVRDDFGKDSPYQKLPL